MKACKWILPWLLLSPLLAQAFALVTPEESRREAELQAAEEQTLFPSRTRGSGPRIVVDRPDISAPVAPPVSIRLRFEPADGAPIVPASLRILYGIMRLDVTSRVLEHAQLSSEGLTADNVSLPAGSHRFVLQIRDGEERVGEALFRVTVLPAD